METNLQPNPENDKNNKKSANETGHAKNIANFQHLLAFLKAYGSAYNPTKVTLQIPQLEALLTEAESRLAEVMTQNTTYNNKVNERFTVFNGLKSLSTRLVNALQTTSASDQVINDAKGFNRKLQGQRATKANTAPTAPNAPAPNTISVSQQSYIQQLQHFAGLITVLKSEPSYAPNETDLQITTLETKQSQLATKNNEVSNAYVSVSNSRIARNNTLYINPESIFATASDIKKYIKSIFGATSPEFAQVKGIEFKKPNL